MGRNSYQIPPIFDKRPSPSRKPRNILVRVLAVVVVLILCSTAWILYILYGEDIRDWSNVMRTSRGLPEAQIRFEQIYSQIAVVTQDSLLEEQTIEPLRVPPHLYSHCIRSSLYRIHGTNRAYDSVLADYSTAFREMGWQYREVPALETTIFYTEITHVEITPVPEQETQEHPEWQSYRTVYGIRFTYAEPNVGGCYG